jgi:uncharacterized coiled-coil DUF342 family protein
VYCDISGAANLSPGVSVPSNLSNSTYENKIMDLKKKVDSYKEEITNMVERMDAMHNMIQIIMSLIDQARVIHNILNLQPGRLNNQ